MNKNSERTFKLTATALLVTLGIVLSRFTVYIPLFGFPSLRFGFTMFPIVIVGALFGGIYGAAAGFVIDIMGYLLFPAGPYHPGFTLNNIIIGTLSGVFFSTLKQKNIKFSFYRINIAALIVMMLCGLAYVNIWGVNDIAEGLNIVATQMTASIVILLMGAILITATVIGNRKKGNEKGVFALDKLIFINLIIYVVVNLVLTPIWVYQLYNVPIGVSTMARVFKSLFDIPLYVVIQYSLLTTLYYAGGMRRWLIKQA